MPKAVDSNTDITNLVEYLSTGKDVDIYLCGELLNDMIVGINVQEGGVPEKITSFNSSIVQHYALPPLITEIQLLYYHTPINVDKLHRILINNYRKILKAFHSNRNGVINQDFLDLLKSILAKPIRYSTEHYSSDKTTTIEDICKMFSKIITETYSKDLETIELHMSRTFLSDENYNLKKDPNTYVDIALNNVTSEFYGMIIKYYNLFIVNMARYFTDDIVIDENIKYLFITSIYNRISLVVTTNKSRKIVPDSEEEYIETEEIADFKKYIGIMPYGPFMYNIRNTSEAIISSKTIYSIGRFDDIFIPRNDGVPQNQEQLSDMVDPPPKTFQQFVDDCESKPQIIFKNLYEINDFMIYAFDKTYQGITNTAARKHNVTEGITLKTTHIGGANPLTFGSIKSIYKTSIKLLMNSYQKDKSILENLLVGVAFDPTDAQKTLNELFQTNGITNGFINSIKMPGDSKAYFTSYPNIINEDNKHNVYVLLYNDNETSDITKYEYFYGKIQKPGKYTIDLTKNEEIVDDGTDHKMYHNIVKVTITNKGTEYTREDRVEKHIVTIDETTTTYVVYSIGALPDEYPGKPNDFNSSIMYYTDGKPADLKLGQDFADKIEVEFKEIIIPESDKSSDSSGSTLKFLGVDTEVSEKDTKDIMDKIKKIDKESLILTVYSPKDSEKTLKSISMYTGD